MAHMRAILSPLGERRYFMRIPIRAISLASASLAVVLLSGISTRVFASGDDKSPAPASTASKNVVSPNREKKVYTNDEIDRMWPKPKLSVVSTSRAPIQMAATPRPRSVAKEPLTPERDPLWTAEQVATLEAELGQIMMREEGLREFAATRPPPTCPGLDL